MTFNLHVHVVNDNNYNSYFHLSTPIYLVSVTHEVVYVRVLKFDRLGFKSKLDLK